MSLRCKPGDLAIITRERRSTSGRLAGRMVDVLHIAPNAPFPLPDGSRHTGEHPGGPSWVVRFDEPVNIPTASGGFVSGVYACIPDQFLLPIRPEPDPEETTTEEELSA